MKKLKVILLACFAMSIHCVYAQNDSPDEISKEECAARLRESYVFVYFRNPADTVAAVNSFVNTIDRIVPMSKEKREKLGELVPAGIEGPIEEYVATQIEILSGPFPASLSVDYIPFMGGNVNTVIKANFSDREYALIHKTLTDERDASMFAYRVLQLSYREELWEKTGTEPTGVSEVYEKLVLDGIFEWYNIM